MSKHTPGPWRVLETDDGDVCVAGTKQKEDGMGEFKWLSRDQYRLCTLFKLKPLWEYSSNDTYYWNDGTGEFLKVDNAPDFLKVGQLWERVDAITRPLSARPWESWRGYWWRKAEDHSQQEQPAEPANDPTSLDVENLVDAARSIMMEDHLFVEKTCGGQKYCKACLSPIDRHAPHCVVDRLDSALNQFAGKTIPMQHKCDKCGKKATAHGLPEGWAWRGSYELCDLCSHSMWSGFLFGQKRSPSETNPLPVKCDWWNWPTPTDEQCEDLDPWIRDRRPTEEDAWRDMVIVFDDEDILPTMEYWNRVVRLPWQPVPASLRVPPRQEQPETCEGCPEYRPEALFVLDDQTAAKAPCCWANLKENPTPGMPGCIRNKETRK